MTKIKKSAMAAACRVPVALAYVLMVYTIACVFYIILSRISASTPFLDSLTPQQRETMRQSAKKRKTIFTGGILFGTLFMIIVRPFKPCK